MSNPTVRDDPTEPRPFQVNIPDEEVARMNRILADTRLPDQPPIPGASWDYGVDLDWLKGMRDAWLNDFDWRAVEREMNLFSQFTVAIESLTLHFVHQKSSRPDAIPIILFHGWPGSFWEYHRSIKLLTDPPAGQPAFHVVVPSLPGYAFSTLPPKQGWSMADNARIFDHLMTGVLGYSSYMAAGGDWGALVTSYLGTPKYPACKVVQITAAHAKPTLGALLTLPFFLLPASWRSWLYGKVYSDTELHDFARVGQLLKDGLGYFVEHATRPLTIGYALHDSPVGLLAWIGEKYPEFMDPAVARDATQFILTTVSLYFLTGCFASAGLPYRDNLKSFSEKRELHKPYGVIQFHHDVNNYPESWIRAQHPSLVFMRRHSQGGHFPGYEVPELLTEDLREIAASQKALFAA